MPNFHSGVLVSVRGWKWPCCNPDSKTPDYQGPELSAKAVSVGTCGRQVALGQLIVRVLRFSLADPSISVVCLVTGL
jgi:hypothetical protein